MSVHPSLSGGKKSGRHRNVLKRYERIQWLKERELWPEGRAVLGLPKVKSIKFKVKKAAKEATSAEAGAAPTGGAAAAATPAPTAKPKASEKGAKK